MQDTFVCPPAFCLDCPHVVLLLQLQDVAHLLEEAQSLAARPEGKVVGGFSSCHDAPLLLAHPQDKITLQQIKSPASLGPYDAKKPSSSTDVILNCAIAALFLNGKDGFGTLCRIRNEDVLKAKKLSSNKNSSGMNKRDLLQDILHEKVAIHIPSLEQVFQRNGHQVDFFSKIFCN